MRPTRISCVDVLESSWFLKRDWLQLEQHIGRCLQLFSTPDRWQTPREDRLHDCPCQHIALGWLPPIYICTFFGGGVVYFRLNQSID